MEAERRFIELTSATLRVVVDVGRGGQLVHIGRIGGPNVLFHAAWNRPRPSTPTSGYGSEALDWLSHYRGGWQVMFPNAGQACVVDGISMSLHGEVSVARPSIREAGTSFVVLETQTRRSLRLDRRIQLHPERPVLIVEEHASNDGHRPVPVAWGQHPALAAVPGARIDLPAGPIIADGAFDDADADLQPAAVGSWPLVAGRDGREVDLSIVPRGPVERVCYLPDRPDGWAALRDEASGRGVALAWDVRSYPHVWLWEQLGGRRFPFFGRSSIMAVEPVSCWPADGLAGALERGQALFIEPGRIESAWITLTLFEASPGPVTGVDRAGRISTSGYAPARRPESSRVRSVRRLQLGHEVVSQGS